MSALSIDIIIRNFNRSFLLDRALKSVTDQSFQNWKILVIDNFSSDNSKQIVKKYKSKKIQFLEFKNNGIIAAALNYGLSKAESKFIAILDSDDWWLPKKLEYSIQYLLSGYDIVYHDLFLWPLRANYFAGNRKAKCRVLKKPIFSDLLQNGPALNCSSVVMRSSLLIKINGFSENPNLVGAEDHEAWIRLSRITEKFYKIDKVLGYYNWGLNNLTSPALTIKSTNYIFKLYKKNLKHKKSDNMKYAIAKSLVDQKKYFFAEKYFQYLIFKSLNANLRFRSIINFCIILVTKLFYKTKK